jgi:hypothetical protein
MLKKNNILKKEMRRKKKMKKKKKFQNLIKLFQKKYQNIKLFNSKK